jgi:hypothetical protein
LTSRSHRSAVGIYERGHLTADPASLETALPDALEKIADVLKVKAEAGLSYFSWPSTMAERLIFDAGRIFSLAELPTPEKATAVRMAALCLAVEADVLEHKDIGDRFRQVAVRITLLERRAAGELPTSEVILHAVDPPGDV